MNASGQRICLNMIVKNEAPVIRRCLSSVIPIIDTWVIVDTGSTDGTQAIVREALSHLPGELHERPWVDFATNRSEALQLARGKGDFVFVIDADEILEIEPGFSMPPLAQDSYNLQVRYSGMLYLRRQLVNNALPWRYEGVVHEYITCEKARSEQFLPGLCTVPRHDGARARDPETYKKDAALLEQALETDPRNCRHAFYLAQSYRDAGLFESAQHAYQRRVELGGWIEEVWYSLYQIAQLKAQLQRPWSEVMEAYLAAWQKHPGRAGPLYRIAMHYQSRREYATSHLFLSRAMAVKRPSPQALFVESSLYDYQIALDYAVASYYVGDHEAAISANNAILRSGSLPRFALDQVIRNRRFSLDAHYKQVRRQAAQELSLVVFLVLDLDTPRLEFDECIDSVLHQKEIAFSLKVLTPETAPALEEGLNAAKDIEFLRIPPQRPWSAIREAIRAAGADLALVMPARLRLDTQETLQHLRKLFEDATCMVAYGQVRSASGELGHAEPPASPRLLEMLQMDPTSGGPILVRASLLNALADDIAEMASVLRAATYDCIRFSDEVVATQCASALPVEKPGATLPAVPAAVKLPKISCLMVTLDRLTLARQSIRSFAQQTYPNRELVIVTDGTAAFRSALERYVQWLGLENVRFVLPGGPRRTLGALRNLAMEAASGELLCQWDDDDSNHPERLMVQAQHLLQNNAGASFFTDHLQLIEEKRALCWIDWAAHVETPGPDHLFPGSLMMRRAAPVRYPESGQYSRQGEDSVLLYDLHRHVDVKPLRGKGHLYLYRYHGRNTFSRDHHYNLSGFRCTKEELLHRHELLRDAAHFYALPSPCYVMAREGPAFVLEA